MSGSREGGVVRGGGSERVIAGYACRHHSFGPSPCSHVNVNVNAAVAAGIDVDVAAGVAVGVTA